MFPRQWQGQGPVEERSPDPTPSWSERLLLWIAGRFPPDPASSVVIDLDGRSEKEYEDELEAPLHAYLSAGPDMFAGKKILDLGSGVGASAARYREWGAASVTGVEAGPERCAAARAFVESRGLPDVRFIIGVGEQLPLPDGSFDLLTMFDVMEHVISPEAVLRECFRVLSPGGLAAIVFPPYYMLTGGSHLHGYFTSFPGLNLLFSTKTLRAATARRLREEGVDHRRYLRDVPSDKLWGQNGLTASRFKRMVRESGFSPELIRYIGFHDHRLPPLSWKKKFVSPMYWPFELAAATPILQEAFCVRVAALLRKT